MNASAPSSLHAMVQTIVREDWGRILASLTKSFADLALAEDALQDAVEAALIKWPKAGLPSSPAAWLIVTARRKAIDRLRRDKNFARKQNEIAYLTRLEQAEEEADIDAITDKRLELIFACCHPALPEKSKVALTLRTIAGLTTEEIAKAFLDPPKTMAQRLTRAKNKIKLANIPFEVPSAPQLVDRINDVLAVVYLIFNEGYAASSGDLATRVDLSDEAIRIGRILCYLLPSETEAAGLLALMLLHDSRRYGRAGPLGELVPLERQNRARWDRAKFRSGQDLLTQTLKQQRIGPYQIQACISALHCEAESWAATDWAQIAALYALLYRMQPTPVVRLNQAAAISYAQNPQAALDVLEALTELNSYQPYFALKADLLARCNMEAQAQIAYEMAIRLSGNAAERRFLQAKMAELGA